MGKLLLVEDDPILGGAIKDFLEGNGFTVEWIDAPVIKNAAGYDIAVIDWLLGRGSGIDLVKTFKNALNPIPVIMITVKSALKDKLSTFDVGVDDYLTKPFHPEELLARIRALLKRYYNSGKIELSDNVYVDLERAKVEVNGDALELTKKEFLLLEALLRRRGKVVSYDFLIEYVWGYEGSYETLKSHVYNLRRKLGRGIIRNVKNLGYRID